MQVHQEFRFKENILFYKCTKFREYPTKSAVTQELHKRYYPHTTVNGKEALKGFKKWESMIQWHFRFWTSSLTKFRKFGK